MSIKKQIILGIIILMYFSCENKSHMILFRNDHLESEILTPPIGCYKVRFIASGTLNCEIKLDLFMDFQRTNFLDHLNLNGNYVGDEIYFSDWYENNMQIKIRPDSCIGDHFEINVEFLD